MRIRGWNVVAPNDGDQIPEAWSYPSGSGLDPCRMLRDVVPGLPDEQVERIGKLLLGEPSSSAAVLAMLERELPERG